MEGSPSGRSTRRFTDSEMDVLANELLVAREIQSWLLPKKLPRLDGYDFDAWYEPAEEIAGDYYDFFERRQDEVGFIVADACGKGIPAALLMVHTRGLIRIVNRDVESPADILRLANGMLMDDVRPGAIVTAQYVMLNPKRRMLKVASAGHLPLVLYRARKKEVSEIHPAGMPLGSAASHMFDPSLHQTTVVLEPGDRFVMITDGATEARNGRNEEFGLEAVMALVREHGSLPSSQFTARVVAGLREFRGAARRSDDVTIVTGRLTPYR